MRIVKINKVKNEYNIFEVTLTPSWIERLFGKKEQTIKVKSTDERYVFGGGNVYIYQNGEELGNHNYIGEDIDQYLKRW